MFSLCKADVLSVLLWALCSSSPLNRHTYLDSDGSFSLEAISEYMLFIVSLHCWWKNEYCFSALVSQFILQANSSHLHIMYNYKCSCGSVVEHCVSSAKGCGFDSQGTHILIKKKKCIAWMHCKSLWIKASAKCINVNVNYITALPWRVQIKFLSNNTLILKHTRKSELFKMITSAINKWIGFAGFRC